MMAVARFSLVLTLAALVLLVCGVSAERHLKSSVRERIQMKIDEPTIIEPANVATLPVTPAQTVRPDYVSDISAVGGEHHLEQPATTQQRTFSQTDQYHVAPLIDQHDAASSSNSGSSSSSNNSDESSALHDFLGPKMLQSLDQMIQQYSKEPATSSSSPSSYSSSSSPTQQAFSSSLSLSDEGSEGSESSDNVEAMLLRLAHEEAEHVLDDTVGKAAIQAAATSIEQPEQQSTGAPTKTIEQSIAASSASGSSAVANPLTETILHIDTAVEDIKNMLETRLPKHSSKSESSELSSSASSSSSQSKSSESSEAASKSADSESSATSPQAVQRIVEDITPALKSQLEESLVHKIEADIESKMKAHESSLPNSADIHRYLQKFTKPTLTNNKHTNPQVSRLLEAIHEAKQAHSQPPRHH